MVTTVIRGGSTVRIQVRPRSIADTYIEDGFLFVVYSDGEIDNVGPVGGGGTPTPTPTPTPSPTFTTAPDITPASGTTGDTFTGIDGTLNNGGTVVSRRWLLDGTAMATTQTYAPSAAGSLVFENTGTGGVVATSTAVTVAVAPGEYDVTRQMNLFVDGDVDTIGERDDIAANGLIFATQEHFNIRGLVASAPDSNSAEYLNEITAYELDRDRLLSQTAYPERFKTGDQLRALVTQGSKVDAPAAGRWASGDAGYAAPHAAAQKLIMAAQTYGDPSSADPLDKLWVFVQGGYTTIAQAAYEAVELGGLPDFFQRIRIVGQPNYNSWWAPNAWNYLFSRIWPAAGTPGLFGDAWMLNGYLQWHAFNRDNGGSDTTFWNTITAGSAFGAHLRATLTRPGGAFVTPHFRAGDAGAWLWLISAKMTGNFDPTNAANWCGKYRTYVGTDPWPSQTVGYGNTVQTQFPNPEGVTFSPTMFAPEINVVSDDVAYTAVNLAKWYEVVEEVMSRYYRLDGLTGTTNVALPGTKPPVYSLTGPNVGTVGEPVQFSIGRIGAAPPSNGTATLSDASTVALPTGTNPVTFNRTPSAVGNFSLTLNAVSFGLIDTATATVSVSAADTGGPIQDRPFVLFDYHMLSRNSGQTLEDIGPAGRNGQNGTQAGADSQDGVFSATTGFYLTTNKLALIPYDPAFNTAQQHYFVAGSIRTTTAVRVILHRDSAITGRVFQLRTTINRAIEFVKLGGTLGTQTFTSAAGLFADGIYNTFELMINGLNIVVRLNGATVITGTLSEPLVSNLTVPLMIGARVSAGPNYVEGPAMDYVHMFGASAALTDAEALEARNYIRAQVLADYAITLPGEPA